MNNITLSNKIREALGKHYGVGWMHAMGYKCHKYKEDSYTVHKFIDYTRTKTRVLGVYKKDNLILALLNSGVKGNRLLKQIEKENKDKQNFSFACDNVKVVIQ